MLAARLQTQAKARFVQHHIAGNQQNQRQQHEPVKLEAADIDQEGLLGVDILDGGGHVVRVGSRIHGLYDDRRQRRAHQIHRRAHQRLIGAEVDGRHCQQQGIKHAEDHRGQDGQADYRQRGCAHGQPLHHQRAAQRAKHHDALQADIDHARMLGEAAAQRNQHQYGSKDEHILNQQDHCLSPPFSSAARFSLALAMRLFIKRRIKSTKPHR